MGLVLRPRFGSSPPKHSPRNGNRAPQAHLNRFVKLVSILDAPFQSVVKKVFEEPEVWEAFSTCPSSRQGHHCHPSGNLLHTLEVSELCLEWADAFADLVDKQVLITSSLLHDVGKCTEYEVTSWGVEMSDTGKFVGHKFMGGTFVGQAMRMLRRSHPRHAVAILNCIASTDSSVPGTRGAASFEAQLLARADQLSAIADLFRQSRRRSGGRFYGWRHPHMRETPIHIK